jgi:hypothetical protein
MVSMEWTSEIDCMADMLGLGEGKARHFFFQKKAKNFWFLVRRGLGGWFLGLEMLGDLKAGC